MEIQDIKQQLTLSKVISHYGLKADKQNRLRCPFHNDRTPSLQLYYKTQTCYCFSSNCKTHGKSIDVIDFIMYYENITKHEAIDKAKSLVSPSSPMVVINQCPEKMTLHTASNRGLFLENLFTYFKNAVSNSKPAQEYILSRALSHQLTEIGYNSGQFHHGARKDKQLIEDALQYGLLIDQGKKSRLGEPAYKPFGKSCIVFPLRDKDYKIVSLYFRSIFDNKDYRHYYLKDRQGLYPHYPDKNTTKLILTESIIDAATLLEQEDIKQNYSVLALYGTNGLTEEHKQAISELSDLAEIIFALDNDPAGESARNKYTQLFTEQHPHIKLSTLELPCKDINETLQAHDTGDIFTHLLEKRIALTSDTVLLSSNEEKEIIGIPPETNDTEEASPQGKSEVQEYPKSTLAALDASNPYNLKYRTGTALYQIKGFKADQADSLKVTLQIVAR